MSGGPGSGCAARPIAALVLVAAPFVVAAAYQAIHDSPTFDEPVYLHAGLAALQQHQVRLNDEHPPLAKAIAALPVLAVRHRLPKLTSHPADDEHDEVAAFVRLQDQDGRLQREIQLARVAPILEALAVGVVIFAMGASLFGPSAGLVAAALWWWNPLTIAMGHLDGIDIAFTLTVVLVAWATLSHLQKPTLRRALLIGVAGGACLLTRHTGILVVCGVALTMVVPRPRAIRHAAIVLTISVACVWLVYLALGHEIVPMTYLDGVRRIIHLGTEPGPGYLLGQRWIGARWWSWPVALIAKVPATTLGAAVVGVAVARRCVRWRRSIAVPMLLLGTFTLLQSRPVGVRYLLPVMALMLIGAGAALTAKRTAGVTAALGVVAVVALAALTDARAHAIAWSPWPFAPVWRAMTDSNVDWGQDYAALESWTDRHPGARVAYFGPRGRSDRSIPGARPLLGVPQSDVDGWVAVSATLVTGDQRDQLGWLRGYCPTGSIGGSVLTYQFRSAPHGGSRPSEPHGYCSANTTST